MHIKTLVRFSLGGYRGIDPLSQWTCQIAILLSLSLTLSPIYLHLSRTLYYAILKLRI